MVDGRIDPIAYRAERPIFTLLDPGSIPTSVFFFFFRPNPTLTLTLTLTLTDDRLPIGVALVRPRSGGVGLVLGWRVGGKARPRLRRGVRVRALLTVSPYVTEPGRKGQNIPRTLFLDKVVNPTAFCWPCDAAAAAAVNPPNPVTSQAMATQKQQH